jgi:PAS domain S-box-containing protein
MKRPLRVLLVEDRDTDAEIVLRELRHGGFAPEWERVETEAGFLDSLQRDFDIILSDYAMPQFDGLRALALVKERALKIPFILVSGTMGEETAVMAMKQGATDYLLKDRLARLGSAVTRALEQSGLQRHKERAEKASRESEERFCQLAANIQEVFWLTDPTKNLILYVSPGYETVWGRSCAAVYADPQSWLGAIHPEDREAVRQAALTKQTMGTYDEEYRIIRPDGSLRWIHDRASPVRNDAGEIYRVVGVARDITEQKATQEAIRQSESRLRALLTSMDDLVLEFDEEGRYVAIWTLRDDLLSHPRAELLGRRIAQVHGEKAAELFISVIKRVMKSKMAESLDYSMEVITGHRQFVARVSPIVNTDGSCDRVCILSRDVTEQKKLEAQFLRAQRLESIGTLASGVAHDLNNILVPILMAAPLLRDDLPEAEREKLLTIVQASAERGASIVKQVLTFARGADGDRVLLQPIYVVQEVVKIAEKTFPKSIYVCANYPEDLWTVVADPTQLHQILLNLCINARDAMPTGGRLTLDLENFGVDDHYVSMTPGAKAGPHVLLEVRDTGTGISPENIDKIFDPFFTTKELNHGTGLGLSTVIGIVKSHGGFMQVYSEAGRGTSFKVFLPANVSELAAPLAIEAAPSPRGNGELLLVVDDENSILQVAKVLLEGQGYRVLTAADAAEALAIFALRLNEIELVLTDLAMPFMDGVALIRTMQKMKPGVRLVASTGRGGQDGRADEIAHLNVRASLTKPYNKNKLLTTLHDVLTQPSANHSTANAQLETSTL